MLLGHLAELSTHLPRISIIVKVFHWPVRQPRLSICDKDTVVLHAASLNTTCHQGKGFVSQSGLHSICFSQSPSEPLTISCRRHRRGVSVSVLHCWSKSCKICQTQNGLQPKILLEARREIPCKDCLNSLTASVLLHCTQFCPQNLVESFYWRVLDHNGPLQRSGHSPNLAKCTVSCRNLLCWRRQMLSSGLLESDGTGKRGSAATWDQMRKARQRLCFKRQMLPVL